MTDQKKILIIVARVEENDRLTAGSKKITATCGHKSWLARSSILMIEKSDAEVITSCWDCVEDEVTSETAFKPVPGLDKDLAEEFGLPSAFATSLVDQAVAAMGEDLLNQKAGKEAAK